MRATDVEAIAVCFLYSFVDPAHERLVEAEVRARFARLYVSLSSDVSPEFREYERLSTTVLNAYLGPTHQPLLQRFGDEVGRLGDAARRRTSTSRTAASSRSPPPPSSRCARCSPGPARA